MKNLKDCSYDVEKKDFLVKQGVLCEILNCSAKTITNYVNRGMPSYEHGKQKIFYSNECKEWINKEILKISEVEPLEIDNNEVLESEFSFLSNKEFKQFSTYYNDLLSEYVVITTLHKHLVKDLAMLLLQKEKIYSIMLFENELNALKNYTNELKRLESLKSEALELKTMLENNLISKDEFNNLLESHLENSYPFYKNKHLVKNLEFSIIDFEIIPKLI